MNTNVRWALVFLAVVVAGLVLGSAAFAQMAPPCGKRDDLLAALSKRYQESITNQGTTTQGSVLEVTVSPSGSWTIMLTSPGGPTCLVSAGEGWEVIRAPGQDT